MPSISGGAGLGLGLLGASAIGGAGSIAGAEISAQGAQAAANEQLAATQLGVNTQKQFYAQNANNLLPYGEAGQGQLWNMYNNQIPMWQNEVATLADQNATQLNAAIPGLTAPFQPTMAQLAQTPGYQFTLQQGEQAAANAYSGQGLGAGVQKGATAATPSGPGAKGAINYAEGLASTTYQQQFQNYLGQNSQIYNMLTGSENQTMNQLLAGNQTQYNMGMGQAQLGEQSAAALAGVGQSAANSISGLQSAGGAALAAGTQSAANAVGQGVTGATSGLSNFALLNALGGGGLFSGGGGSSGNVVNNVSDNAFDS